MIMTVYLLQHTILFNVILEAVIGIGTTVTWGINEADEIGALVFS